ncbi:MAG: glycoside hydrolase family 38 N-terminal domain-containing protein [Planctomycetota bacterium]|jgi:hypothetical protein
MLGRILLLLFSLEFIWGIGHSGAVAASIERIYVLPMSHLDIGFTAPPSDVASKMAEMTDKVIYHAGKDPGYVWNFETFWQLDQWLAGNPGKDRQRQLVELVRSGRVGVGAAYVTPHSSMMSGWALDRLCEPAGLWSRQYGLQLECAVLNDVPGHPPDMPKFLARAGVKYLIMGINQSLTPRLAEKFCNRPFWWEAPSGERVLTWISSDNYTDAYMKMGFDPATARFFSGKRFKGQNEMAIMNQGISAMVAQYEGREYVHDAFLVQHAFDNWGMAPSVKLPKYARLWNQEGKGPKIIVSTLKEFFEHILATSKKPLPVYRGGFGGAWEQVKLGTPSSVRRLRAAEKLFVRAGLNASDPKVRQHIVLCGHTFGLGLGWPNLLTEDQTLRHNRQQADMVGLLPGKGVPWPVRGIPAGLDIKKDGQVVTNSLYLADGIGRKLVPLGREAWTALPPRQTKKGTWQFRHRIDRSKLAGSRKRIVWAWPIQKKVSELRPQVKTASGWMQLPDDLLDGKFHNGWFSAWATRLNGVEIAADIPLAFCISPEHFRNWIFALCLNQAHNVTFKGGKSRELTFQEAYPGEEPIFEFTIEVRPIGSLK